jgi:hypothetical protein
VSRPIANLPSFGGNLTVEAYIKPHGCLTIQRLGLAVVSGPLQKHGMKSSGVCFFNCSGLRGPDRFTATKRVPKVRRILISRHDYPQNRPRYQFARYRNVAGSSSQPSCMCLEMQSLKETGATFVARWPGRTKGDRKLPFYMASEDGKTKSRSTQARN